MLYRSTFWAWDLYPLAPDACENARVRVREGHPLELHEQRRGKPRLKLSTGEQIETKLDVYRMGYCPTADDLAILRRVFPNRFPENPSWATVEAELILFGFTKADIQGMNAPTLVRVLGKTLSDGQPATDVATGADFPEQVATAKRKAQPSRRDAVAGETDGIPALDEEASQVSDETFMSVRTMADKYNVPFITLKSRLQRFRTPKNHGSWIENPDRKPREALYLFKFGAVRHIINDLIAKKQQQ